MATVHLICGPVGAGKTTYSQKFCTENGCVHFAIDEWMTGLFMPDVVGEITYDWAMERIGRSEALIWDHVRQLMVLNMDVVLDLGLLQKSHRQKFYDLAAQDGFSVRLHAVEADMDTRWQRVQKRNTGKGETYSMDVNRDMFDFCEGLYEKPDQDEEIYLMAKC